jgi:hypothetical protein
MVPDLRGTGPGTVRQRKLGQGREGRKEGKEREGNDRNGSAVRMDGSMDREDIQRSNGGREGWGKAKSAEGRQRKSHMDSSGSSLFY